MDNSRETERMQRRGLRVRAERRLRGERLRQRGERLKATLRG